jgi:hypothetical protein
MHIMVDLLHNLCHTWIYATFATFVLFKFLRRLFFPRFTNPTTLSTTPILSYKIKVLVS